MKEKFFTRQERNHLSMSSKQEGKP